MTKLESIEHKIFASEAPLDEIGQFGSALDTTKLNTKDVTTIQALPAYTKGWGSAIISDNNYPTMEEMNGVLNVMSYHTGYLYQEGIPVWRSDREYSATSIVKEPTGTKLFHSLKDGNIGKPLSNTEYWEELKLGGGGLEICDIGMALYVDETKGLRRYLNGQIVDINTNTQAFLNRLLQIQTTNPEYFTTEDNWQAEATLNIDGCVYKFVLNYSGDNVVSVRLPKYPDYIEVSAGNTATTAPIKELGLVPKQGYGTSEAGQYWIPAKLTNVGSTDKVNASCKLLSQDGSGAVWLSEIKSGAKGNYFSGYADLSGLNIKTTKLKMRYFIQIATGSETENNIINDIELNNPYSLFDSKYSDHELNNLSWLKSEGQWNAKAVYTDAYDKLLKVHNGTETVEGLSVKLSTEDYTDYDFVLNTANETFRLPLKNHTADDGNSVLTLYFYVGETVQNANLINAGRIEEKLVDKVDTNASNFTADGKSLISGWCAPNYNRRIVLTAGATGTVYTAPATGIFHCLGYGTKIGSELVISVDALSTGISAGSNFDRQQSYKAEMFLTVFIPVNKGQKVRLYYANGTEIRQFQFIYAEGSK